MINTLHYLFNKPSKGWDPVPKEYALQYAEKSYNELDQNLVKKVLEFFGDINQKVLIDLGAGPGQYAIAFSQLGAKVVWYDISKNYLDIAKERAAKANTRLDNYVLDYMDTLNLRCDFLFNRVCYYYCINDRRFLKRIIASLNDHGKAYITLHNEDFIHLKQHEYSYFTKLKINLTHFLNNATGIKIGHPHMSKKRIEQLFRSFSLSSLDIEHDSVGTTTIRFIK
jgi:SAM-dependent methyltransferase